MKGFLLFLLFIFISSTLISAQIKTLNEKHANCLSLQSSNNLKLEKIALDQKNYQKCLSELEYWKSQEDLKRQNEECNKTLSTLLKYKEYSNALEKKNRAAILDWEKYRDAVNAHNLKKKSSYEFNIELKSDKVIIGGVGLSSVDEAQGIAEIGYWLNTNYHRQGIGLYRKFHTGL